MPHSSMREAMAAMIAKGPDLDTTSARGKFFAEHGDFVKDQGEIVFVTGAIAEDSVNQWGALMPPPGDKYQRAKNIARYWSLKAQAAVNEFLTYRSFLKGDGAWCGVDGVYSEEDQIKHLAKLCTKAKTAKRYLRSANQEVHDSEPAWLRKHREGDALAQQTKATFQEKLDTIRL